MGGENSLYASELEGSLGQGVTQSDAITVKGTVLDNDGVPVIGATVVLVENSTKGTVTNIDGEFTLSEVPAGGSLRISYVGMKTAEVPVNGRTSLLITLEPDNELLDEVVVVGYGSSRKRDLIASVSTVKTEQISNIPVTNIAQGLAGRSPGLIVRAGGGGVNTTPSISIRGGGEPLYVIDGVIRAKSDFSNLSPDDIASMSILKDASATAVYGSRASNGIIQITTKRGKSGKPVIEYDFNMSWSQPSIWPEKMSSYDRAVYGNIARANDGLDPFYTDEALQKFKDGSDPLNFNNTNWRKLVLNDWAPLTKHTVRVVGGNETTNYYASLGNINQNSLYKSGNHWMKRTNFRLALSTKIEDIGLQINATLDGSRQEESEPYTSTANGYYQIFSHIQNRAPNLPGLNKFGLPFNSTDNPVAETAHDAGFKRGVNNMVNGKGELVWSKLGVKGLQLRLASNYRYYANNSKHWRKDAAQYDWDSQVPHYANKPKLSLGNSNGYAFTNQAFAEYAGEFGKHTVSALAGFEQYYQWDESMSLSREKYDFDIPQIGVGNANTKDNDGGEAELGRAAWIGQAKYSFANKYYLEGSLRYDGSDAFAPGKRWGLFYSGSAGWIVTEEAFMKPLVDKNILNSLKLRASYGQTGLDSDAGRFNYLTSYSLSTQNFVVDGEYAPGFSEGSLPSQDLTWYTTEQTDVGFDFSSLKGRLYGSFDYFYYRTTGYLMAPTGESYLNEVIGIGMPRVKSNSEHRRAGIELQVGWRDHAGDFSYDISGNFTYFDALWAVNRSEAETSYLNPYQRTQQQRGFHSIRQKALGYYDSAEEVYNSVAPVDAMNSGYLTAGDLRYRDTNGDGKIDGADARRLGKSGAPRGQFGLSLNLGYKGFYFSALFQGSTSFDMSIGGDAAMKTGQTTTMPVIYDYQKDFWRPDNRHAQYPRLMSNTELNSNNNFVGSDFWLVDGAYVRFKDFQFGYDFKHSLLKDQKWVSKVRLGLSGQNLFTLSKAVKYGLDPENSSTDGYGYPVQRTIAVTLNVGF